MLGALVIQKIESRELFTVDCQGGTLSGTYHIPAQGLVGSNRTGILLLSGFPMPRSAHGDAAVHWATSFAQLGYPSFRVDLPGVGDSRGNVPAELLQYTSAGGYERVTAELVEQIVARFELAGVVILGQCAGSISAIFAAAITEKCRGLILIDPPFNLPPAVRPTAKRALFHWTTKSRIGGRLSNIYDQYKKLRLQLRKNAPPENANFPLLKRWKQIASAGLPILLLNAPEPKASDKKPRAGKFDYIRHVLDLAGSRSRAEARAVSGANHTFSNPLGKSAIREHVAEWMPKFFPFERSVKAAQTFTQDVQLNDEAEFSNHQSILAPVDAALGVKS
jgi:pimeloyl-ACP methyl ester carboxylesterase